MYYLSLAKKCQPEGKESDYLKCYTTTGTNLRGLFVDLPLSISNGVESISLARNLQMKVAAARQCNFTAIACFNAGQFRRCWQYCNDFYYTALDTNSWTQLGRAVNLRMSVLCILNNPEKAIVCAEHSLALENGMMKTLHWDAGWSNGWCWALFRSGREEEANGKILTAVENCKKYGGYPWYYPGFHSTLCTLTEMLAKAVSLRKEQKIKRLTSLSMLVLHL